MTIDAMTVTLDSVTQNEDLFQVRFSELKDAGRSLESHRQWSMRIEFIFSDKMDPAWNTLVSKCYAKRILDLVLTIYLILISPQNVSLIYESPTSVSSAEFEFELKEIPAMKALIPCITSRLSLSIYC